MSSDRPATLPLLAEGASRLGFKLNERQLEQFQLYYETLLDWNSRVNLTAITDYEGVQVRHFLDGLTVGAALLRDLSAEGRPADEPPEGFSLIDIGTGAGFPGVPLKILWPGIRLTLADSIGKKTAFVKELVRTLDLENVQVVTARAEDLGRNKAHRERYGAVTARAVASLPVLCEYCLPLAEVAGRMLAPKKGDISQELRDAERAAGLVGGGEPRLYHFTLPGETEDRTVVVIRKVSPTPPGYPRRVGLAKSRPLGGEWLANNCILLRQGKESPNVAECCTIHAQTRATCCIAPATKTAQMLSNVARFTRKPVQHVALLPPADAYVGTRSMGTRRQGDPCTST